MLSQDHPSDALPGSFGGQATRRLPTAYDRVQNAAYDILAIGVDMIWKRFLYLLAAGTACWATAATSQERNTLQDLGRGDSRLSLLPSTFFDPRAYGAFGDGASHTAKATIGAMTLAGVASYIVEGRQPYGWIKIIPRRSAVQPRSGDGLGAWREGDLVSDGGDRGRADRHASGRGFGLADSDESLLAWSHPVAAPIAGSRSRRRSSGAPPR